MAFRQVEALNEAAQILVNIPVQQYEYIGYYFLGWSLYRTHRLDEAKNAFEQALNAPDTYKACSLISLGTLEAIRGDVASELKYNIESMKASQSLSPRLEAIRGITLLKAREGFHRSSLKDLESMLPLAFKCEPIILYYYLNSLAVELGAVGRILEARNVCSMVLASPFAIAYPECRETAEELKGPNRSFVVIDRSPARMGKLLSMPVVEHSEPAILDRPASVLSLQEWKDKMVKDKNGKNEKLPEDVNGKDMVVKIMNLTTQEGVSEKNLRKILDYVRKVLSEPDKD